MESISTSFPMRDFNLKFSSWEFNYVYTNTTRVYSAALNNDVASLFQPKSDEEIINGEKEIEDTGEVVVKIDPENFENRISVLPGKSGNYGSLHQAEKGVLYIYRDDSGSKLKFFNQEDEKEVTVLEAVGNFVVTTDGKKILYAKAGEYGIVDVRENQKNTDGRIDLGNLEIKIFPKDEWKQIFVDGWRLLRDWFYDSNMHGNDWEKMREKYEQLVPFVSHRMDGLVAGHWGNDPGAVCSDGLTEESVNLRIATMVQEILTHEGYDVYLLKEFDQRLTEYQALALVSIHNDSCDYRNEQATGFKVAAAASSVFPEKATRLTACISQRYQVITGMPFHYNTVTVDMTDYHAFSEIHSNTTAAIIETGFLNLDRDLLTKQTDRVAQGVASGILCFVRNEDIPDLPTLTP